MKNRLVATFIAAAPLAALAEAGSAHTISANVTLTSQYLFRSTVSHGRPTLQAGVDYSHASGWYAGTWFSEVWWFDRQNAGTVRNPVPLASPGPAGAPYAPDRTNANSLEWDIYGGYKRELGDWSFDFGFIQYEYPGRYENVGAYRRPHTTEVYAGAGYKWLSVKYYYAVSPYFFSTNEASGAWYLDLSAAVPLRDGLKVLLHAGRQQYPRHPNFGYFGNSGGTNADYSYTDYRIGLTKDWEKYTFGVAWSRANTKATAPDGLTTVYRNAAGQNIGGDRLTAWVTRSF